MSKKDKNTCALKKTSIGGQALIEGIMMRGPQKTAMAVRNTEGEIVIEKWDTKSVSNKKITKLPLIRGIFAYVDSMVFGYKCLMRSAEISGLEQAEEEMRREKEAKKAAKKAKKNAKVENESCECQCEAADVAESIETEQMNETKDESIDEKIEEKTDENVENKPEEKKKTSAISVFVMVLGIVLGLGLSVLLFFAIPSILFDLFARFVPSVKNSPWVRSVFEGVLKLAIMVGYMAAVSLMEDIRRTFMFHGAEHKTIFCYEQGLELTIENVRKQKRFHPRCGTSFLILMVLVSIFISFFIPIELKTPVRVAIELLTLPIIVGVGYELIKLAGKYDNLFTRIISAPGVWLQKITTKEPDDKMIECAIVAIKEVIPEDDSDKW